MFNEEYFVLNDESSFFEMKESISNMSDENPYKQLAISSFRGIQTFEYSKENSSQIRILTDLQSGLVDADILGKMIQGLQSTVEGAYNFLFGNGSSNGKIPDRYSNRSKLLVSSFSEGSFIVNFDSKQHFDEVNNISLFDKNYEETNNIVDLLFSEIVELDDYENIRSFIDKYGLRTFNRTRQWINSIKNTSFEYGNLKKDKKIEFSDTKINSIAKNLSKININTEVKEIEITGKLIIINNRNSKLTFENDNSEVTIRVKDESIDRLQLVSNEVYTLEVQEMTNTDNYNRFSKEYYVNTLFGTQLENKKQ